MDKDQPTKLTYNEAIQQNDLYELINDVFNSISILCSCFVLITIITLRIRETNYSNRISLRLIMYISLTEILFSISQMLRIRQLPKWISYLASLGFIFSSLLICFFIIAILVNIKLIFLCDHKNTTHYEKYYILIPISLAFMLTILPFSSLALEFDPKRNCYWYSSTTWEWTTYFGWITWTILCCIFSISLIFHHLKKHQKLFKTSTCSLILTINNFKPSSNYLSKIISQYISRIIFYSLVPVLTHLPTIISDLVFLYGDHRGNSVLNIISLISLSSQGIFTFVIFLFDPIIYEMVLERQRDKSYKQAVLGTVTKGVYVENIYKIELELPSVRKPDESKKRFNIKKYYSISDAFSNKENMDTGSERSDDDTISLL